MFLLKIYGYYWDHSSRDKKELSVCQDLGMDVAVLSKGETGDKLREANVEGFKVYLSTTRPLGEKPLLKPLNHLLSLFAWSRYARRLSPDIISGHDIIGLFVGYLSNFGKRHKAALVYDSHEFELERNEKRSHFKKFLIRHLEKFLMDRAEFSIMVNDSIADEVQKIHHLKDRPLVVRNIPPKWNVDKEVCKSFKEEIIRSFPSCKPKDGSRPFLGFFHGNLMLHNGLETLIKTLALNDSLVLLFLGEGKPDYIESLKRMASECGVADRLLIRPPVPFEELWKYVGAADVELMMIEPFPISYYLCLPNKLFESIQAETPVIASALPEMRRIVEGYGIGFVCEPFDAADVSRHISELCDDGNLYSTFKSNLKKAKEELCWENEKSVLAQRYKALVEKITDEVR